MRTFLLCLGAVAGVIAALYAVGVAMTSRVETVVWQSLTPLPGAKFVTTKSGRVHYVDVGEGPPVLLMHGSGGSIAGWQEGLIEQLATHHRVIAFDYFGNGFSERSPAFTYGYTLWVEQAVELLDTLKVDHVTVIGHSVGGVLACVLAADHPDRVDHVVTIGTGMTIEPQQFLLLVPGLGELALANATSYGSTGSARHRAALERAYAVVGTRSALLAYARRQLTIDGLRLVTGTFEDVKAPVLHLSGSRDVNIAPSYARALAERTKGKFVSIEGATHYAHIDAPARVAVEVEKFLAEASVKADGVR
jgi:pimeloyl-ACP methyl ester carboxylesterase